MNREQALSIAYEQEFSLIVDGGGYDQEEAWVESKELNHALLADLLVTTYRAGRTSGFLAGYRRGRTPRWYK